MDDFMNSKDKELNKKGGRTYVKELAEDNKRAKQEMEDCLRQEALQENEERFRVICALAQDAIIVLDNEGNISYWNKAAESTFGYRIEQVIGKNLHALFVSKKYQVAICLCLSLEKDMDPCSQVTLFQLLTENISKHNTNRFQFAPL